MEGEGDIGLPLVKEESGYVRELSAKDCHMAEGDDEGSLFEASAYQHTYTQYFQHERHINYVTAPQPEGDLGPMAISIGRLPQNDQEDQLQVLIHSKEGWERERISIEDVEEWGGQIQALKKVRPSLESAKFSPRADDALKEKLAKYEQRMISLCHKFGVLYSRAGQTEELDFYNNEHANPEFEEFLTFLGEKIELQGFTMYSGGLDTKSNTTGTHSIYTRFGEGDECEIMFHPLTYLPYSDADPQQIERKRHIGNDVVVIVFREADDTPFSPSSIQSQFNHVFVVVTPIKKGDETFYRVALTRKEGIPSFGPPFPDGSLVKHDEKGRRWFLRKLINAERAAFKSPTFQKKFVNVRKFQIQYILQDTNLEDATEHELQLLQQDTQFSRSQLEDILCQLKQALNRNTQTTAACRMQLTAEEFHQIFIHICPSWRSSEHSAAIRQLYSEARLNGDHDQGLGFVDFVRMLDCLAFGGPSRRLGLLRRLLLQRSRDASSKGKEGGALETLVSADLLSDLNRLSFSDFKKRAITDAALLDLLTVEIPEGSSLSLIPPNFVASEPGWWKADSTPASSSDASYWNYVATLLSSAQSYYNWKLF